MSIINMFKELKKRIKGAHMITITHQSKNTNKEINTVLKKKKWKFWSLEAQ